MSEEINLEQIAQDGEAPSPEGLDDLSDEQLDALLGQTEESEDGVLVGELTLDEEEATEDKDEAEAEPDDDEGTPSESEDEAEATDDDEEEEDVGSQIRDVLQRLEIMQAENDKLASDLEREKLLRDRNAGKLGSLMQQLERTRDTPRAADDSEFDDDAEAERPTKSKSAGDEALAEIRSERVNQAVMGSAQDFYRENVEFFEVLEKEAGAEANQQFQADLIARLQSQTADLGENLQDMSPKMAAKVSTTLLRGAFADMQIELLRDVKNSASAAAEESRRKVRARKKGAAGVRSVKRAAVQSVKTKSLSEMSDEELDQALREVTDQFEG